MPGTAPPVGREAAISGEARSRPVEKVQDLTQERNPHSSPRGAQDAKDPKPAVPRPRAATRGRTATLKTPGGKSLEIRRVSIKTGGKPRGDSPGGDRRVSFRKLKEELPRHQDEPKKAYKRRLEDALAARVR